MLLRGFSGEVDLEILKLKMNMNIYFFIITKLKTLPNEKNVIITFHNIRTA